jgi:type I restriction enzyme S subunit
MAGLSDNVLLQTERRLTSLGLERVSSGELPAGTVLLSSRAPIGYLAITEIPVSVNQGIIAMICDSILPNLYVLHWTSTNMERIVANANGSTFLEISKMNFRPITALVPPGRLLQHFTSLARPLHQRVVASLRETAALTALRDALLPALVSGQLTMPDAERIVGKFI